MLTYKDISEQFSKYSDAKNHYWRTLQEAVHRLSANFETSLDLPKPTWESDGQIHRYVEVGKVEHDEFVVAHPMSLHGREDLSLPFAIKLTVERGIGMHPKFGVWVEGRASMSDSVVSITIKAKQEQTFQVMEGAPVEGYSQAAEAMKVAIFKLFEEGHFG